MHKHNYMHQHTHIALESAEVGISLNKPSLDADIALMKCLYSVNWIWMKS